MFLALAAFAVPVVAVTTPGAAPVEGAASNNAAPVTAPIALMIDHGSGRVLFSREPNRRFIPASLTKIMTAYVAFELIAAGKLDPNQRFTVTPTLFREWSGKGTTMFLPQGAQVSANDLLHGIVTVSANDACAVLAEGAAGSIRGFTDLMNTKAQALGMTNSHFNTPNGWPDEGQTYVSAADLAKLTSALITRHPDLYARYFGHDSMTWNGITQSNRNPLYGATAGADGVKTGFTNEAGYGFVGSAARNGRRLVMVVAGFDKPDIRRDQSRAFIEWGFAAWDSRPLFGKGQTVGAAAVQGGSERAVDLVAPQDLSLTVPRGSTAPYTLTVRYRGPLKAPIASGQEVAQLVVSMQGEQPVELPLAAAQEVAVAGPFDRLRNGLLEMLGL